MDDSQGKKKRDLWPFWAAFGWGVAMICVVVLYAMRSELDDAHYRNAELVNRVVVAEREYGRVERLAERMARRGK